MDFFVLPLSINIVKMPKHLPYTLCTSILTPKNLPRICYWELLAKYPPLVCVVQCGGVASWRLFTPRAMNPSLGAVPLYSVLYIVQP